MVNPRARRDSKIKQVLKRHYLPVVIALIVTFVGLFGSDVTLWLRYDRNAILSGEIWRIFTGHLAHLSWTHLLMNLLGLALVWGLFDRHLPAKRWIHAVVFSAFGTSLLLLVVDSHLRWYVGLSGVLHGMFIVGCMYNFCNNHHSLRLKLFVGRRDYRWVQRTPAMAAGLTDHCWSVHELFFFKVPPPRWAPPKHRGRPSKTMLELINRWC